MRKALAIALLTICLVPAVSAPPAASAENGPVDGGWLITHMPAEPGTLNPITSTDAYASEINGYIYESLIRRDPETMKLVPELAESWEISDDHLTYTFHLRKDVHWQDGEPFTADDVLFSYNRINDPGVDAAHLRSYYRDIEKVEVLDDYTVRYRYSMPYFRALEFCGGLPIVPEHLFDEGENFNTHPIGRNPMGTGPYKMLRWDTGKEIVLVRDKDYWGGKPHLDRIVFRIITDNTVALQVLKQGQLDVMGLQPIQWIKQTRGRRFERDFEKHSYYLPRYSYIGWNLRKPYFSDSRVRRAMTMLVDRRGFLEKILYGLGTVVTGNFYVNGPDYNHEIEPWPYDPERATELLEEAGWTDSDGDGIRDKDGVPFEFEFMITSGSRIGEQIATLLQENLKKVGIAMTIRQLEWAVFIQNIDNRNFDAATLGWSLSWESDPYQVWHSSQAESGSNYVGFKNEEADRIIEKGRRTFDDAKRHKMYHRFHEIVHEQQPYTFLFTTEALVAVQRRFENVEVYPLGLEPERWWVPLDKQRYGEN
jgi:peptide/nickel transport system substrate-binding protein